MKLSLKTTFISAIIVAVTFSTPAFSESSNSAMPDTSFDLGSLVFSLENNIKKETNSAQSNTTVDDNELLEILEEPSETATELAKTFPEKNRANAEKLFKLALYTHIKSEQVFQLPKNDVYGAATAFIYGNWSSYYNGKMIEDKYIPTLVKEVKILLEPTFSKKLQGASKSDKKTIYEKFAMIGNWMLIMQHQLKKQPNAQISEKLKTMSEGFFKELGIEASRLNISRKGHIEVSKK